MIIFKRELRANLKSFIIWSVSSILMVTTGMLKFDGLSSGAKDLNSFIAGMPKALQFMFGGSGINLSTAIGFFGLLIVYIQLMAAIYGATLGANIISKEERDKTTEFLIVKPITRTRVIAEKLLVVFIYAFMFSAVTFLTSIITLKSFNVPSNYIFITLQLSVGLFLLQLVFSGVGALFAAIYKDAKKASSIAVIVLFGTYFISILISMSDNLNFLNVLSPFEYFKTNEIINGGNLSFVYSLLAIAITSVMTVFAFKAYNKRDLMV